MNVAWVKGGSIDGWIVLHAVALRCVAWMYRVFRGMRRSVAVRRCAPAMGRARTRKNAALCPRGLAWLGVGGRTGRADGSLRVRLRSGPESARALRWMPAALLADPCRRSFVMWASGTRDRILAAAL